MAGVLEKTNVNLELLTDVDMLLMIEAGIRGGMSQHIYMLKQVINTWRTMIKELIHDV